MRVEGFEGLGFRAEALEGLGFRWLRMLRVLGVEGSGFWVLRVYGLGFSGGQRGYAGTQNPKP